jgi:hypothetical protein
MGLDIIRVWDILAVLFAFNAGFSMYAEKRTLILIQNYTTVELLMRQNCHDLTVARYHRRN